MRFSPLTRGALAGALVLSLTACVGYPAQGGYGQAYPGGGYTSQPQAVGSYPAQNYPSTSYPAPQQAYAQLGRVSHIERVRVAQPSTGIAGTGIGTGAVVGGVLGGVLGNQVGKGNGRTLATVAGVVAGGMAGNAVEKNTQPETYQEVVRVTVKLQDGSNRSFDFGQAPDMRVGDRVRVENNQLLRDIR